MKLIQYNSELQNKVKEGRPTITAGKNSSDFRLSKEAYNLINAQKISFEQDSDRKQDWYIVEDNEKGFLLSDKHSTSTGHHFRCAALRHDFLKSLNLSEKETWRFLIGSEPVILNSKKYYPIFTKGAVEVTVNRKEVLEEKKEEETQKTKQFSGFKVFPHK